MSSFAYVNEDNNPTGFTNNWLESRKMIHTFDDHYGDFPMYEEPQGQGQGLDVYNQPYNTSYRDITKTIVERSPVSDMFLSHNNVKHLKGLICSTVYRQSGGKYRISPEAQSDNDLLLVMRSIFLNNAKHLPDQIKEQVAELNYLVLLDMVPRVISNAQHHLSFIRDHSQQGLHMDRPQYMSTTGTRSNQSVSTKY